MLTYYISLLRLHTALASMLFAVYGGQGDNGLLLLRNRCQQAYSLKVVHLSILGLSGQRCLTAAWDLAVNIPSFEHVDKCCKEKQRASCVPACCVGEQLQGGAGKHT